MRLRAPRLRLFTQLAAHRVIQIAGSLVEFARRRLVFPEAGLRPILQGRHVDAGGCRALVAALDEVCGGERDVLGAALFSGGMPPADAAAGFAVDKVAGALCYVAFYVSARKIRCSGQVLVCAGADMVLRPDQGFYVRIGRGFGAQQGAQCAGGPVFRGRCMLGVASAEPSQ